MDAVRQAREDRKEELLRELAEINVAEQVEEGVFLETPHFSIIERAAAHLGRQLSRQAQERAAREVAANCATQAPCPGCQTLCDVQTENRFITSADGPVEVTEAFADCEKCRRSFFPSARGNGTG